MFGFGEMYGIKKVLYLKTSYSRSLCVKTKDLEKFTKTLWFFLKVQVRVRHNYLKQKGFENK